MAERASKGATRMFDEITFNSQHGEPGTLTDDAAFLAAKLRVAELCRQYDVEPLDGNWPTEPCGRDRRHPRA
jgi:hypothetical protein